MNLFAGEPSQPFRKLGTLGGRASRNAVWLLVSRIGVQGLMAVFTILVARRMGDVGLGQYAFIASAIYLANVATTFGTDMLVIRVVAADHDLSSIPAAIILQTALTLPAIGLIWLLPGEWFNLSSEGVSALRLYSFALVPMSITNALSAGLRGLQRMDVLAVLSLFGPALQVAAVWLLLHSQGILFLSQVLLALQVASGMLAIGLFIRTAPQTEGLWRTSVTAVQQIAAASMPAALMGGLGILYQRAIIYLLMLLAGPAEAGWYSAASRVVEAPRLVHYALMGALLPLMAQEHGRSEGDPAARSFASAAFALSLGIASAAAILLVVAAQPLVNFIYGPVFTPASPILQMLAVVLIPATMRNYLSVRILATGQERHLLAPLAVSTLALIPTCVWAFRLWGVAGAAGAVVAAECLQAVLYLAIWRRMAHLRLKGEG